MSCELRLKGWAILVAGVLAHCAPELEDKTTGSAEDVGMARAALTGTPAKPVPDSDVDVGPGGDGHAESWDGRLYIAHNFHPQGGWYAYVQRPEALTMNPSDGTPAFSSSAAVAAGNAPEFSGPVLLEQDASSTDSGIHLHNGLSVVPDPSVSGANPFKSNGSCVPDSNGTHECYKMVIVTSTLGYPQSFSEQIYLVQVPATLVVANPRSVDAYVHSASLDGQVTYLKSGGTNIRGFEPTVTADGRLIVYHALTSANTPMSKLFYVWNHNPLSSTGWTTPQPITHMYEERNALVDGVKFGIRYPLARKRLKDAQGNFYGVNADLQGAYPWLSLSAEELVFTAARSNLANGAGHDTLRAATSVVGVHSGHAVRLIDGMLNRNRWDTLRLFHSSPGGLPSLWPPFPGLRNKVLPYRPERPILPVWASSMNRYGEVSFRPFMDQDYLVFLEMNEVIDQQGCWVVDKTADSSGNFNTATLMGGAKFPFEFRGGTFGTGNNCAPNTTNGSDETLVGAKGQAIYFPEGGLVNIPDTGNLALSPEGSFSVHMFVKPTVNDGTIRRLALHDYGFNFHLQTGLRLSARIYVNGQPYTATTTESLQVNQWNAVGFTYDGVTGKLSVYLGGQLKASAQAPANTPIDWLPNRPLEIGPNGAQVNPNQEVMLIDEVAISKVARTPFEMLREAHQRPDVALPTGLDVADIASSAPQQSPESSPEFQLGEQLFADVRMSSTDTTGQNTNDVACASCHADAMFTDGLAKPSAGVGAGIRNTPTIFNTAFHTSQMWDGRSPGLEHQWTLPVSSSSEMGSNIANVVGALNAAYSSDFISIYGATATEFSIGRALAAFQRNKVRGDSPADQYDAGNDNALSSSQKRGREIFFGKGRCAACHNGSNYSDGMFHRTGLTSSTDSGRGAITGVSFDDRAFKTPSLRDVECTGPYFHDGSVADLTTVIALYNSGSSDPEASAEIHPLNLSSGDQIDLLNFLKTLTGSGRCPQIGPPKGNVGDVDGTFISDVVIVNGTGGMYAGLVDSMAQIWGTRNMNNPWGSALSSQQTWNKPLGVGDMNGDGYADIIFVNGTGGIWAGLTGSNGVIGSTQGVANPWGSGFSSQQTWNKPLGVGDVNGDGYADYVFINGNGGIYAGRGNSNLQQISILSISNPWGSGFTSQQSWNKPLGIGDVNGDGNADFVFVNGSGGLWAGLQNGTGQTSIRQITHNWGAALSSQQSLNKPLAVADFNGDEYADIAYITDTGTIYVGLCDGYEIFSTVTMNNPWGSGFTSQGTWVVGMQQGFGWGYWF